MAVDRRTRPLERFWPYAEHPEEPTVDELAALDPDLHAALFGPRDLPFSITLVQRVSLQIAQAMRPSNPKTRWTALS